MNAVRITKLVAELGLPRFRAEQLRQSFFTEHLSEPTELTTLPKALRQQLAEQPLMTVTPHRVLVSRDGRAYKALLRLHDDEMIESVLLNPKPDLWSCCISSQVGCLMKCTFCATGLLGFKRHLSSEEITDQVLFWRQYIRTNQVAAKLRNIVYMGMGEPLHNRDEVFASLREFTNPETFGIGARHLSVSTSGLIPPIYELADQFPQVNLAVSLHAANDDLRLKLMPVNKPYPLAKLREAMAYWIGKTRRKLFIEYIMLQDENDSMSHAGELADYLHQLQQRHLLHVNLIVYNRTDTAHRESARTVASAFRDALVARGLQATIRKNLGRDIDGACGQLALKGAD